MTETGTEKADSVVTAPCGCRLDGRFTYSSGCTVLTPAHTGRQRTSHHRTTRRRAERAAETEESTR